LQPGGECALPPFTRFTYTWDLWYHLGMKLIAQVKLLPSLEQHAALLRTLEAANAASDYTSERAWQTHTFGQFALHKLCYRDLRERFSLGADLAVRVFAKVADAYKLDRNSKRTFKPHGAFPFNDRLVSYKLDKSILSIWTLDGRQKIPFTCGDQQRQLLQGLRGECDLVYRGGEFYLFQTCDVEENPAIDPTSFLGVDLGISNVAVDSDGTFHQGKAVKSVRYRHRRLRAELQHKGTKAARRRLRKLSGKERRFATDTNHVISKQIVKTAKDTVRGIALEELKGIRNRVTARRSQRTILHSWSFGQLRALIAYKAKRAGVPVVFVDPRNTSRTCPTCGHVDTHNRPSQDRFECVRCGCAGRADHFAAVEISRRADVNLPYVSTPQWVNESTAVRQGQAPGFIRE
jgi:putative transposase